MLKAKYMYSSGKILGIHIHVKISLSTPLLCSQLCNTNLGQCSLDTVSSNDDSISLVSAPCLEELSGEAALHHTRTGHYHTQTHILKLVNTLSRRGGSEGGREGERGREREGGREGGEGVGVSEGGREGVGE